MNKLNPHAKESLDKGLELHTKTSPSQKSGIVVHFESIYEGEEVDWENEESVSPYISMASYEDDIIAQRFPNEIVIPMPKIKILYNYPLSHEVIYEFEADRPEGFTRAHLARKVAEGYERIYREEEEAVGDPGHIPGMGNRQSSAGPHGIWGHDLGDLMLHGVRQVGGNLFKLELDS